MTLRQLTLLAACVYFAVLVATVYFTRATTRRVLGAVAGGLSVAAAGFGVEVFCQTLGFWRYPADDTGRGPITIYPLLALVFAVYALIGWRVIRRFGWRGEAVFLAVITVQGVIRDYTVAARMPGAFILAPGYGTVAVDAVCWAGLTAVAQATMRAVAGPAAADGLAPRPRADT